MEKPFWSSERETIPVPVGQGRAIIEAIRQGLKADGYEGSITKLCHWFDFARRSFHYQASRAIPKVNPAFSVPIKALIEHEPSFSYRTVATLFGFNMNTA